MSHNTFGHLFRVTTWGESHGVAIGCVVDGCPPRLPLDEAWVQKYLDQRKPGTSKFVTQRREPDQVKILSGVFEDDRSKGQRTTGTPISMLIENVDQRSKDYTSNRDTFRPGHADQTYEAKYGIRDYRGGGRSSARETASRVAAGAVARRVLGDAIEIRGAVIQIGNLPVNRNSWDWEETTRSPFWCPDKTVVEEWEGLLDSTRKSGSSVGALIEVNACGVPAGWGTPVYGKLDVELAGAMMSINAVKSVEIGAGKNVVEFSGEQNADRMRNGADEKISFQSNHNGGVAGGISTGQDIVVRIAVKPTSSIRTPVDTVTRDGKETEVSTTGRHDPCVGIRAVPVAEAMMACVLADAKLRHQGQTGL